MSQDKDHCSQTAIACEPGEEPALREEHVEEYLRQHPEFFTERAELLQSMTPPPRWSGNTVVDMQRHVVDSLRGEIAGLRDCANEVIETSRANLATQSRTHAAVLALVSAPDIEGLVRAITDDLPILLDVDVAMLSIEPGFGLERMIAGIGRLRAGDVDCFLGPGRDASLYREMADDGLIFGAGAGLVRSAALVRVRCGDDAPVGLLAFGSRGDGAFHPGQGTELLRFLSSVVEARLCRLLPLPT